jgi:hypothetical protein
LPRKVWAVAAERQEAARKAQGAEIYLNGWLGDMPEDQAIPEDQLFHALSKMQVRDTGTVNLTMEKLGFGRKKTRFAGKNQWVWYKSVANSGRPRMWGLIEVVYPQDGGPVRMTPGLSEARAGTPGWPPHHPTAAAGTPPPPPPPPPAPAGA